mgnify:CR=1 FL=1
MTLDTDELPAYLVRSFSHNWRASLNGDVLAMRESIDSMHGSDPAFIETLRKAYPATQRRIRAYLQEAPLPLP